MSILTPDQRLRVFVSSTLHELAEERRAVRSAITALHLTPVMFELGARPHPPRELYRAYLEQSHLFVGLYWERYGWVAPDEAVSGLEDEYRLSGDRPKLIYVKTPAPDRDGRLQTLLDHIRDDDTASYKPFRTAKELRRLLCDDLALLLTERFTAARSAPTPAADAATVPPASPLPVPPTPLVGRARELADLSASLARPEVRLVTLLGPGGVGKSRLALELGRRLEGSDRGSVHFVALAPIRDPALVVAEIAKGVGASEGGDGTLLEALKGRLRTQKSLLILDNFEQVEDAAPVVGELLGAAPDLKVLVTSRSALHLAAEHLFEVLPLEPPGAGRSPLALIGESPAVQLFVERAQAVKPSFTLSLDNALAVAEICGRLDGLPLAIELAAARTPLLTPQALLGRLDKRFALLTGGVRDLPDRQRTLRSTIDWSFDLLGDEEKRLFAALSVFAGGFTLDAAEAVCGEACTDLLGTLASLIDKSLVKAGDAEGEGRFGMLETVREYAVEKLEAGGKAEAVRSAHAAFFTEFALFADVQLKGGDQRFWAGQLEREHDNIRTALAFTLGRDAAAALELSSALLRFWWIRSYLTEGRRWLKDVFSALGEVPTTAALAKAYNGAGILARMQGDYATSSDFDVRSLEAYRALGDPNGVANALNNIGVDAMERRDFPKARALMEEVLALHRNRGDEAALAVPLANLGLIALHERDYISARDLLTDSLGRFRAQGDGWSAAGTVMNLGSAALKLGDLDAARGYFSQSLELAVALGDKEIVATTLTSFGFLAAALGRDLLAARLWGAAAALSASIGHQLPPSSTFGDDEAAIHRVKSRLGDDGYALAYREGQEMGLDPAIALALQEGQATYDTESTLPTDARSESI